MKSFEIKVLALLIVGIITLSCKHAAPSPSYPILKAPLNEKQISICNIFDNIEIIALETSQESFFKHTDKIVLHNDTIFIFDRALYSILMFGPDGNFINKISKVGRGPNEYLMAYDFVFDEKQRSFHLLNPMGSVHKYDLGGNFINQEKLPAPPFSYHHFEVLDDNNYVTWSRVDQDDENGVKIINRKNLNIINEYFPSTSLWGAFRASSVFHKYKGEVYYHETMANKVYRIKPEGFEIAYEWDLGVQIVDPKRLSANHTTINEAQRELVIDVQEGKIPFFFANQQQSERYYYTILASGPLRWKYLFYDKISGDSIFFERTKEGININIIYMSEYCAIGVIMNNDEANALCSVVSAEDAELLRNRKEDDNWWLVKYTFRDTTQ